MREKRCPQNSRERQVTTQNVLDTLTEWSKYGTVREYSQRTRSTATCALPNNSEKRGAAGTVANGPERYR